MSSGCLDILNIGHGHLTFRFDRNDAGEIDKAKKVITDMLKRGYMIFVKVGGEQRRVREFDAAHEEYILEEPDVIPDPEPLVALRRGRPKGSVNRPRVPMRQAKATGIGPTAGG